ncbi:hypothetical protein BU24DRAFT_494823 [Aaosphaeria arxii CBS 175.79]|uniref:Xylanolytic transcriptional activator regulatory domain-containing protein n=1 Tax=Aaosphaeria arxii CBS 175.79 TaxID=1450172 RepID=A0A6A5XIX2_9PLEO|nr:uncharacterized protein BU24DRAFT_494823 [Aaosphaeria arxii CBS 175.79]KAF2012903.1 hypothetical protein BU24DRAFT_494823 [Aaosphaeria arxii CBS 175.79]
MSEHGQTAPPRQSEASRSNQCTPVHPPVVASTAEQQAQAPPDHWIASLPLSSDGLAMDDSEACADGGSIANLPMFQDFGLFTDTVGFMGMDLVETLDEGSFLHYGVNMSFSDAMATLVEPCSSALEIDGVFDCPTHSTAVLDNPQPDDMAELKPLVCPWRVSGQARRHLLAAMETMPSQIEKMPSCLSLNRFCTGYFSEFQSHVPIVHKATFDIEAASKCNPELVVAIASIGAVYRFQKADALFLLKVALDLITRKWQNNSGSDRYDLGGLQALVLLSYFALWQKQSEILLEQSQVRKMLLDWVQKFRIPQPSGDEPSNWTRWCHRESALRTYLASFCILNTYSLLNGTPPEVTNITIKSALPCSTAAWNAASMDSWAAIMANEAPPPDFQTAFAQLFGDPEIQFLISPFGCFVLLHAIVQRTFHLRQLSFNGSLRPSDLAEMEEALARWKRCWKRAPESILDPRNLDASISFQSISYLMMVYLRLSRNPLPPFHQFTGQWDPGHIARKLAVDSVDEKRSDWSYNGPLHSAHSLMIIVRSGIEHHRRTLSYHWDPQHALPWVEGAISLSRWLELTAETCSQFALNEIEKGIILWVRHIIEEALPSLGDGDKILMTETVGNFSLSNTSSIRNLAYGVISAWCCVIPRSNNPWPVVDVAGNVLTLYKSLLRP